ncbi:MAG TPA: hypothetical protein VI298_12015 [Geobacteraceae bacterium]
MIVRRLFPIVIIILLLPAYLFSLSMTSTQRKMLPLGGEVSYVLPSPLLKITALEFDGLASDFMFLKALTFYGGTLERKERPRVQEVEWRWMYDVLNAATDLDPYFYDPYYFANSNFTWEAHMVKEANTLLAKGNRYREWDWTIPFYMGFNEFYFLHDNAKASEYLMQGSKRPDADPILATLAVRMAYRGNRTEIAIVFLQETLKKTKDKNTRRELGMRLEVLQGVLALERAVETYKSKFAKLPHDLNELVAKGLLARIPDDPYCGEFYLDEDGSVKTTSDLYTTRKK